ncbi:MAG TPA: sigma-70 family RNA polymerase sigma factor [Gemmatimonadales bacterium]|nr:sigma-70 family RNA polymerase sigma factor [Gemmatimonadales bacterium]
MTGPAATPPSAPADIELVRAYRAGDERAATTLVTRHAAGIARFLNGAGADGADLDDLVQETFIRAFRAIDGWRGEAAFRSWLLSIASNLLKDQFRKQRGRTLVAIEETELAAHEDPASALDATEAERRLAEGLATLPRLQREVFLLRAQQGLDYEEIARTLDTTAGSARVHYHHAVKRLKELVA